MYLTLFCNSAVTTASMFVAFLIMWPGTIMWTEVIFAMWSSSNLKKKENSPLETLLFSFCFFFSKKNGGKHINAKKNDCFCLFAKYPAHPKSFSCCGLLLFKSFSGLPSQHSQRPNMFGWASELGWGHEKGDLWHLRQAQDDRNRCLISTICLLPLPQT